MGIGLGLDFDRQEQGILQTPGSAAIGALPGFKGLKALPTIFAEPYSDSQLPVYEEAFDQDFGASADHSTIKRNPGGRRSSLSKFLTSAPPYFLQFLKSIPAKLLFLQKTPSALFLLALLFSLPGSCPCFILNPSKANSYHFDYLRMTNNSCPQVSS